MFIGTMVTVNVMLNKNAGKECSVVDSNWKLGLGMYVSYFILFAVLFYNLYLKPGGKHSRRKTRSSIKKSQSGEEICGVQDGAGFFHTKSEREKREKTA